MEREIPRSEEYQSPDGAKVLQVELIKPNSINVFKYQSPDGAKVLQGTELTCSITPATGYQSM